MMKWMKFIVLDTWRKGRLKLKHRSHIDFVAASIFEPQRASGPGACPCFRQDDSIIQLNANGSLNGFSLNFHF